MLRTLTAGTLALHGLIHLIGFVVPWRIAEVQGFAYSTAAAWGQIELGDGGARLVGVLWLFAGVGLLFAAYGIWQRALRVVSLTAVMALGSLVLCILGSPAAVTGIVINIVILAVVAYFQLVGLAANPGRIRPRGA